MYCRVFRLCFLRFPTNRAGVIHGSLKKNPPLQKKARQDAESHCARSESHRQQVQTKTQIITAPSKTGLSPKDVGNVLSSLGAMVEPI